MDVSIIIVNYNTKKLIADCIKSIYEHTKDINFEVIVSDNGSKDGSIEMLKADFPQVILIENNANLGFGTANNRGLKIAKGKYVFYLNSDTLLLNNAIKIFFDYFETNGEKENIGALGTNLLDRNGNITHSYGNFPRINNIKSYNSLLMHNIYGFFKLYILNKFFKREIPLIQKAKVYEKYIGEVEYITGADLFVKNNSDASFDENYFLYCEETDLQYRLLLKNKKRIIIDTPKILHLEGGSQKSKLDIIRNNTSFGTINYTISQIYFLKKYSNSKFQIFIMKILTLILWCNPMIFPKNYKYFGKIIGI